MYLCHWPRLYVLFIKKNFNCRIMEILKYLNISKRFSSVLIVLIIERKEWIMIFILAASGRCLTILANAYFEKKVQHLLDREKRSLAQPARVCRKNYFPGPDQPRSSWMKTSQSRLLASDTLNFSYLYVWSLSSEYLFYYLYFTFDLGILKCTEMSLK